MKQLCSAGIIRAHAEPGRQSLASWEQGSSDEASLFKSPGWAESVSVDGIAPGDMHGLGGRNSQGNERQDRKTDEDRKLQPNQVTGRHRWWKEGEKGFGFNQTSLPTVSHIAQIRQRRASTTDTTQVIHCVLRNIEVRPARGNKGLTEWVGERGSERGSERSSMSRQERVECWD